MRKGSYKHPNLMYALICLFIFTLAYWASHNAPGESFTTPVYCENHPVDGEQVCVDLQVWIDGNAPGWMFDQPKEEPRDEALPAHEAT